MSSGVLHYGFCFRSNGFCIALKKNAIPLRTKGDMNTYLARDVYQQRNRHSYILCQKFSVLFWGLFVCLFFVFLLFYFQKQEKNVHV